MKTNINLRSQNRSTYRRGFTMIELLVVMFIVAGLGAISFGVFFKMRDSSKEKETTIFLNNIITNMEAVRAETGVEYPEDADGLFAYLTGGDEFFGDLNFEVKPAMPELLPGNTNAKFVNSDDLLIDSWRREIEYEFDPEEFVGGGVFLKSDGIDPDKEADDIEKF